MRGQDRITLGHTGFGLAGAGSLANQGVDLVLGPSATTSDPTVIFDPVAHQVWWDADGTGASNKAQLLATLTGVNIMSASDFVIV